MTLHNREEKKLLSACAVLFGTHLDISSPFLEYIELSGVKSAYRNRVKETHPDLVFNKEVSANPAHDFLMVQDSYEQLCHYLAQRTTTVPQSASTFRSRPQPSRSSSRRSCAQARTEENSSTLPSRRLMLGEFLFHSGLCQWRDVTQALAWQRWSRPRLGELGCNFGWMEKQDIQTIFSHLQTGLRFGETAVRIGLLTPQQLERLLRHQAIRQQKIGQFFLKNNLLSQPQLQETLWHLSRHNFLARQRDNS